MYFNQRTKIVVVSVNKYDTYKENGANNNQIQC